MVVDFYWIGVGGGNMVVFGNVFIEFDVYEIIVFECVYFVGFCFLWF